jgi:hypothetical protein
MQDYDDDKGPPVLPWTVDDGHAPGAVHIDLE